MAELANTYYSKAHPKVFKVDGKRVTLQIISCFKHVLQKNDLSSYRLLDVGSSSGAITYYLANYVKKAFGIDPDAPAIIDGVKRFKKKNLKLSVFDGQKIPYPESFFDLVVFRRVYGSTDKPETLVKEMYRVLKPGGLCYFEGHNKLFFFETDYKLPFLPLLPPALAKHYVRIFGQKKFYLGSYMTYWELKRLFSKFSIDFLTAEILKNPQKFKFTRLYSLNRLLKFVPLPLLKTMEPFYPDFIWILRKC